MATILVIDDTPTVLQMLSALLKDKGHLVLIAKGGERGLSLAKDKKPDLILLDVMMPGMSGHEVLTELKSNNATKNIPTILITGNNTKEDKEKGLALGASDYLHKPLDPNEVLAIVEGQDLGGSAPNTPANFL